MIFQPLQGKKSNETCTDCDPDQHTLIWIIIGFLIGGLVFGVLCYIMGSMCSTTHTKVNSTETTTSSSDSTTAPPINFYSK